MGALAVWPLKTSCFWAGASGFGFVPLCGSLAEFDEFFAETTGSLEILLEGPGAGANCLLGVELAAGLLGSFGEGASRCDRFEDDGVGVCAPTQCGPKKLEMAIPINGTSKKRSFMMNMVAIHFFGIHAIICGALGDDKAIAPDQPSKTFRVVFGRRFR
jgi:hypothetical protein